MGDGLDTFFVKFFISIGTKVVRAEFLISIFRGTSIDVFQLLGWLCCLYIKRDVVPLKHSAMVVCRKKMIHCRFMARANVLLSYDQRELTHVRSTVIFKSVLKRHLLAPRCLLSARRLLGCDYTAQDKSDRTMQEKDGDLEERKRVLRHASSLNRADVIKKVVRRSSPLQVLCWFFFSVSISLFLQHHPYRTLLLFTVRTFTFTHNPVRLPRLYCTVRRIATSLRCLAHYCNTSSATALGFTTITNLENRFTLPLSHSN